MKSDISPLVNQVTTLRVCKKQIQAALALQGDLMDKYSQLLLPQHHRLIDFGFFMMHFSAALEYTIKFTLEKFAKQNNLSVREYLIKRKDLDENDLAHRPELVARERLNKYQWNELSLQDKFRLETRTYAYLRIKTIASGKIDNTYFAEEVETRTVKRKLIEWELRRLNMSAEVFQSAQENAYSEMLRILNHQPGRTSEQCRNLVSFLERCIDKYFYGALLILDPARMPKRLRDLRAQYPTTDNYNSICRHCGKKRKFLYNRHVCPVKEYDPVSYRLLNTSCYRHEIYIRTVNNIHS